VDARFWLISRPTIIFKTIPVVILTTSASEADVEECYRLAANCYLQKPGELEEFERLVKGINDFWLAMARLPSMICWERNWSKYRRNSPSWPPLSKNGPERADGPCGRSHRLRLLAHLILLAREASGFRHRPAVGDFVLQVLRHA
jgi:CheY-like chemotaxis protein